MAMVERKIPGQKQTGEERAKRISEFPFVFEGREYK